MSDASVAARDPTAEPKEAYRRVEGEALGFSISKREAEAEAKEAYRRVEGEALGFSISKGKLRLKPSPRRVIAVRRARLLASLFLRGRLRLISRGEIVGPTHMPIAKSQALSGRTGRVARGWIPKTEKIRKYCKKTANPNQRVKACMLSPFSLSHFLFSGDQIQSDSRFSNLANAKSPHRTRITILKAIRQ